MSEPMNYHMSTEEFRRHRFLVDGMIGLSAAPIIDDGFAWIGCSFAAYLGDEGSERIIIVLCPAIERMVVALGALYAHAHEYLGHVFREL